MLLDRDVFHLVLPTAVSSAIRYFVLAELGRTGMTEAFQAALAHCYAELFAETPLLGGRIGAPLRFRPGPHAAFAETMMHVDLGRYIHFLFFTDTLEDVDETGFAGINVKRRWNGTPDRRAKGTPLPGVGCARAS